MGPLETNNEDDNVPMLDADMSEFLDLIMNLPENEIMRVTLPGSFPLQNTVHNYGAEETERALRSKKAFQSLRVSPQTQIQRRLLNWEDTELAPETAFREVLMPQFNLNEASQNLEAGPILNELSIETSNWSADEDEHLRELYMKYGPRWAIITHFLPSKSSHSIRHRFSSFKIEESAPKKFTSQEDALILQISSIDNEAQIQNLARLMHRLPIAIHRRYGELIRQREESENAVITNSELGTELGNVRKRPREESYLVVDKRADALRRRINDQIKEELDQEGNFTQIETEIVNNFLLEGKRDWSELYKLVPHYKPRRVRDKAYRSLVNLGLKEEKGHDRFQADELSLIEQFARIGNRDFDKLNKLLPSYNTLKIKAGLFNCMRKLGTIEKWTELEDELIRELFKLYQTHWQKIALYIPGRTLTDVPQRFLSFLPNNIEPKPFLPAEDEVVLTLTDPRDDSEVIAASRTLNRLPIAIRRRYSELTNTKRWNEPLDSNRIFMLPNMQSRQRNEERSTQTAVAGSSSAGLVKRASSKAAISGNHMKRSMPISSRQTAVAASSLAGLVQRPSRNTAVAGPSSAGLIPRLIRQASAAGPSSAGLIPRPSRQTSAAGPSSTELMHLASRQIAVPAMPTRHFTQSEDELIKQSVRAGNGDLNQLHNFMPHHDISAIERRVQIHMNEKKKVQSWTENEIELLRELVLLYEHDWERIAMFFPRWDTGAVIEEFLKYDIKNLIPASFLPLEDAIVSSIKNIESHADVSNASRLSGRLPIAIRRRHAELTGTLRRAEIPTSIQNHIVSQENGSLYIQSSTDPIAILEHPFPDFKDLEYFPDMEAVDEALRSHLGTPNIAVGPASIEKRVARPSAMQLNQLPSAPNANIFSLLSKNQQNQLRELALIHNKNWGLVHKQMQWIHTPNILQTIYEGFPNKEPAPWNLKEDDNLRRSFEVSDGNWEFVMSFLPSRCQESAMARLRMVSGLWKI